MNSFDVATAAVGAFALLVFGDEGFVVRVDLTDPGGDCLKVDDIREEASAEFLKFRLQVGADVTDVRVRGRRLAQIAGTEGFDVVVVVIPGGHLRALNRCELSPDRKSTRLNSSHLGISYAVFCLKKK